MIPRGDFVSIPDPDPELGPPFRETRLSRYEGGWGHPREPNRDLEDSENGNDQPRLTWFAQWRFIRELRENADFRADVLDALGLSEVAR